jgi:hypothetical protein
MDGFNCQLKDEHDANDSYWQPWEINEDLFDCLRAYYINNTEENVKHYELGGVVLAMRKTKMSRAVIQLSLGVGYGLL